MRRWRFLRSKTLRREETTRRLLGAVRDLERAGGSILTDCGMQACALLFDVLVKPRSHAVLMRQVYNKTRKYLEWLCARAGAALSIVDDGDDAALAHAVRPDTVLVFAETYTNPLLRAVDPERDYATRALAVDGAFRIDLPVGRYTLLAATDERLEAWCRHPSTAAN